MFYLEKIHIHTVLKSLFTFTDIFHQYLYLYKCIQAWPWISAVFKSQCRQCSKISKVTFSCIYSNVYQNHHGCISTWTYFLNKNISLKSYKRLKIQYRLRKVDTALQGLICVGKFIKYKSVYKQYRHHCFSFRIVNWKDMPSIHRQQGLGWVKLTLFQNVYFMPT